VDPSHLTIAGDERRWSLSGMVTRYQSTEHDNLWEFTVPRDSEKTKHRIHQRPLDHGNCVHHIVNDQFQLASAFLI